MTSALYLLSNDLRFSDNQALSYAAEWDTLTIVYCINPGWFTPNRYGMTSIGERRWRFTQHALVDLDHRLRKLGQRLHMVQGNPVDQLQRIINRIKPDTFITSRPQGWYERQHLLQLSENCPYVFFEYVDNYTLFKRNDGDWLTSKLAKQYTPFRRIAETQTVHEPRLAPEQLPTPSALLNTDEYTLPAQWPTPFDTTLSDETFIGGETAAQHHLQDYLASQAPSTYKHTRNALSGWSQSSKWSPWLSQGAISPRQLFNALDVYEAQHGTNDSTQWLRVELLWREYFQWLALRIGISLYTFQGLSKCKPLTSFYAERFRRWCEGTTPYPLVNACMRELLATGYMSNRGRQIVASCLVNELQMDWRYGAAWFEQQLIDYDVASNWGNWQYIAGVGVDPRGGRHFDLAKQQRQFDPNGRFVNQWLGDNYIPPRHSDSVDAADWPISPP